MKNFLIKTLIFVIITVVTIITLIIIINFNNLKTLSLEQLPLNNVSNSDCFRAKTDHITTSDNFRHCTFLIAGSSTALCNISGEIIQERTKNCVYNISSWGLRSEQINKLFEIINIDSVKYLLVAFSNIDFGKAGFTIDYKEADRYINGNKLIKVLSFINKFNINIFTYDCYFRNKFSKKGAFKSVVFDDYGSALIAQDNLNAIDKAKLYEDTIMNKYNDTIGFNYFFNEINKLDSFCNQHKISLNLVYLPNRTILLSRKSQTNSELVSQTLHDKYGKSFIDLHKIVIPLEYYCDNNHISKDGAGIITTIIIDSLNKRK